MNYTDDVINRDYIFVVNYSIKFFDNIESLSDVTARRLHQNKTEGKENWSLFKLKSNAYLATKDGAEVALVNLVQEYPLQKVYNQSNLRKEIQRLRNIKKKTGMEYC